MPMEVGQYSGHRSNRAMINFKKYLESLVPEVLVTFQSARNFGHYGFGFFLTPVCVIQFWLRYCNGWINTYQNNRIPSYSMRKSPLPPQNNRMSWDFKFDPAKCPDTTSFSISVGLCDAVRAQQLGKDTGTREPGHWNHINVAKAIW